ncbi:MAG: NAD(P)(+) transhydrogenase (Re/Si-specific) subunit beta [Meiothermus sp.]|uniref:NAD(P)(+) transhydrogenase (Re/Si-specific) subunit beta n=1 Tax=Meiothermus sp. TaxID=1955249 RepID=UPI0025DD5A43|nr:NAD(P)(+) transhydrogenase (Re/Si-specific) subunit beta [Meiothermus sp.]MCS7059018.1 NAD(P)(+) transhydrogenase (Re/Si-specific) subunit beta [Meiothermus sp.]MCS7194179.1 NAD(P)(+) transhydrogenase (Re/Si-specific) subunit beta [Meiothermus sp.]MCX7740643.1 NAD(P)(+) transhydrogenase (Re/Si-specific) subunit beta [Meiothermus sp.]MDW8090040.1 NAD(P)(+) transhydrogenase (Re/Si-specific) subunit beta [Meiothermus sp.]MDW8480688.1 NAD(P)(+) transhydrogenase (Re/Si-specific) subunit beta [Me
MENFVQLVYFATALLFILGLKRMSSPNTARSGVVWAGVAMVAATAVTFLLPDMRNQGLMLLAIAIGTVVAWIAAKRVQMTDMPQMVAIYNGMGGGAAGAIAAVELLRGEFSEAQGLKLLAILGALIGSVSFTGSLIAFAKLQGLMSSRPIQFPSQQVVNAGVGIAALLFALVVLLTEPGPTVLLFFLLALAFGVLMTLPIGGGDMPVVISLYNAFTGLAVGFEGFAIGNAALIVAGTVVGAAGTLLTFLMAKAMNRSLWSVLVGGFGVEQDSGEVKGSLKPIDLEDAAVMLAYASKVIFVPGYGMAVAQAQHKLRELADVLEGRGVEVKFAIHPVAGRMPGHMNVLLAEAGVAYEKLFDLEDINPEFPQADVAVVIGANDVVNPAARRKGSPLYGMPILEVDKARNAIVIKRGQGRGFAGVENELFYAENTRMLYGDAQSVLGQLVQALKKL